MHKNGLVQVISPMPENYDSNVNWVQNLDKKQKKHDYIKKPNNVNNLYVFNIF